ncbi:hypothetical protein C8J56DRAFT_901633 [Mycena floridula]|nr:hypothetical protein C8J56DRAFT_901633 [Mycena floridula]
MDPAAMQNERKRRLAVFVPVLLAASEPTPHPIPISTIQAMLMPLSNAEIGYQSAILAGLDIPAPDMGDGPSSPPRPEKGGSRITIDWLCSIPPEESLWRFRMSPDELVDLSECLGIRESFITTRSSLQWIQKATCTDTGGNHHGTGIPVP